VTAMSDRYRCADCDLEFVPNYAGIAYLVYE